MQNKIEDLRNHLFATLEDLRDKDNPMALDRAKVIADVAAVIVESAKAENKFIEVTHSAGSGFIPRTKLIPAEAMTPRLVGDGR